MVMQSQEYAAAAAGIMAIEAGHAAVIRNQLYSYQVIMKYLSLSVLTTVLTERWLIS